MDSYFSNGVNVLRLSDWPDQLLGRHLRITADAGIHQLAERRGPHPALPDSAGTSRWLLPARAASFVNSSIGRSLLRSLHHIGGRPSRDTNPGFACQTRRLRRRSRAVPATRRTRLPAHDRRRRQRSPGVVPALRSRSASPLAGLDRPPRNSLRDSSRIPRPNRRRVSPCLRRADAVRIPET